MSDCVWRDGDPVAGRRFVDVGAFSPEFGGTLPNVRVAYETWGRPVRDTAGRIVNAVLVLHALTGDAHVSGPSGPGQPTPGWWDPLLRPGAALDPSRWFVLGANVLGGCQGTTGPGSLAGDGAPWGSRWPHITVRDQVAVEARLADELGIARFAAVIGGSMGGMRALEWAVSRPNRVGAALVLAVGAAATADQIGTQVTQQVAITADPAWRGGDYGFESGPIAGLGVARRIAHLTYRAEGELAQRFGATVQDDGRFAVGSYLDHHADKLARRFDARSYVALTEAMNTHDVGRGRGGTAAALASIRVPMVVAGIDTDRLYPLHLQRTIAETVPNCDRLDVVVSPYGHDGFLIESDAVGDLARRTLSLAVGSAAA